MNRQQPLDCLQFNDNLLLDNQQVQPVTNLESDFLRRPGAEAAVAR